MPPSDPPTVHSVGTKPIDTPSSPAPANSVPQTVDTISTTNAAPPATNVPKPSSDSVASQPVDHPSVAMTTGGSGGNSKFGIFLAIFIVLVIGIWAGVGYLYYTNTQLSTESDDTIATSETVETKTDTLSEPSF